MFVQLKEGEEDAMCVVGGYSEGQVFTFKFNF